MDKIDVYFSLGSNMGNKEENIRKSIKKLEEAFLTKAKAVSSIIETEPWGFECDENFMNAAVSFELPNVGQNFLLHSLSILRTCKDIERSFGREEYELFNSKGERQYFSRPIDIDILFYGKQSINTEELIIPHLHIKERDFVLIPLKEIITNDVIEAFPQIFN